MVLGLLAGHAGAALLEHGPPPRFVAVPPVLGAPYVAWVLVEAALAQWGPGETCKASLDSSRALPAGLPAALHTLGRSCRLPHQLDIQSWEEGETRPWYSLGPASAPDADPDKGHLQCCLASMCLADSEVLTLYELCGAPRGIGFCACCLPLLWRGSLWEENHLGY